MLAVSVGSPACTEDSPRGLEGSRSCQPECEAASSRGCPPGPAPARLFTRRLHGLDLPSQRAALGHCHRPPGPALRPRRRPASPLPTAAAPAPLPGPSAHPAPRGISAACGRGPAGAAPSAGDSGIHNSDCRAGPSSRPAPRVPATFPSGGAAAQVMPGRCVCGSPREPRAHPLLCTSGPRTAQPAAALLTKARAARTVEGPGPGRA